MTRGRMLEHAWWVAWRFVSYDSYGQSRDRARRALARRAPGCSRQQYEKALDAALALVRETHELVAREWRRQPLPPREAATILARRLAPTLAERHRGFLKGTLQAAVSADVYYWHLR